MSPPPCMPWWIGDYLRDTQHLSCEQHGAYLLLIAHCWQHGAIPPDDFGRAQVTRLMTVKRWNAIKDAVLPFFEPDGTHRRVTKELARVERLTIVRRMAGSKGGTQTAISRVQQLRSRSRSPPAANTQANTQPNGPANAQQKASTAAAYQTKNQNLTSSSEYVAARARTEEMPEKQQNNTAGSLATALGGALTRPPDSASAASTKRPSEMTRDDFEKSFADRRKNSHDTDAI